jgi:hypothetical protein
MREVNDRVDHDIIPVTAARGDFRAIKLRVEKAPVQFFRVVVNYAQGEPDRVELRNLIRAGGESRVIDLRGPGDRVIRSVEFWYEAKSIGRGRSAVIRLLGRN